MKVLLIELGESHDDGLVSWIRTLEECGVKNVAVACTPNVHNRIRFSGVFHWVPTSRSKSLLRRISTILAVRRYVRRNNITHCVVNTASGTYALMLLAAIPKRCKRVGILHFVRSLTHSTTQQRISRLVQQYVVISPHLLEIAPKKTPVPISAVPQTARLTETHEPHTHTIRVAIPGAVDARRRAYRDVFCDAVMDNIPPSIQFHVVGNAGSEQDPSRQWFYEILAPYKGRVRLHSTYLTHEDYHAGIAQCHAVLPLIHPGTVEYADFMNDKSSGAFTLAWTYGKPLFLERGFEKFRFLHHGTMFYDVENLVAALNVLAAGSPVMQRVRDCAQTPICNDAMRRTATMAVLS